MRKGDNKRKTESGGGERDIEGEREGERERERERGREKGGEAVVYLENVWG